MIKILELFGGVGSPRAALRNIGVPVKSIDYVEVDEKAIRSYNAMFCDDLDYKPQDVRGWNLKPDILIHGSPCQDFSIAGRQKGADPESETRSSLMWETVNIIKNMGTWRPRIVIWENVKNVLSRHMIRNYSRYISELDKLGYTSNYAVLNALILVCLSAENVFLRYRFWAAGNSIFRGWTGRRRQTSSNTYRPVRLTTTIPSRPRQCCGPLVRPDAFGGCQ